MNRTAALALAVLFPLSAMAQESAQEPTLQERIEAAADRVNRPLVLHLAGEDRVRVEKDLAYRTEPEARADVYLPAETGANGRVPIVVLLHGNAPSVMPVLPKDWGFFQSWGRLLAASGFVTVVFNHRLGYPEPRIEEAAADVEALLAFVRSGAERFGADPDRLALVSFSGGGPLLAPFLREPRPYVRAIAAFYSILETRGSQFYAPFLTPAQLERYSPVAALEAHAETGPPMFVMRAGNDQTPGLKGGMQAFVEVALQRNVALTLMIHPRGEHGFENQNDDARTREILRAAIEFLRTHLAVPTP